MLTPAGQPPVATTVSGRLVGAVNPPTQVVLDHPIAQRADPDQGVAALRQIWRHTSAGDTRSSATGKSLRGIRFDT